MIAYLSGKPFITSSTTAIVCHGVGYDVRLTQNSQRNIKDKEVVDLFIYTHVKDDAIELYGFVTEAEKFLFMKLIGVDGVGPKTALTIMDQGVESIVHAVQEANVSFFTSIPRVGKKSAQKIIIDLKNKLGGSEDLILAEPEGKAKEVVEALVSLGFSETESQKLLPSLDVENMRVEDAVKKGIQLLTKK